MCNHITDFLISSQLLSVTHIALQVWPNWDNDNHSCTVRMVFKQSNALFVFLCALPVVLSTQWECVECWDCRVFVCVCMFRDTPSLKLGSLCLPPFHSVTHLPSLTLFFHLLLPLCMSACFLLLLSSLSPPTRAVCIPARRGGGVCDPCSIRTRPPLHATLPRFHPHPLPGKMGATSTLAGHRLPFECAASHGSRDLTWFVCLLLRVCTKP